MKKEENSRNVNSSVGIISSIRKSLEYLINESKLKRSEMSKIKNNIRTGKQKYNTEIKKYSTLTEQIIKKEEDIECIYRKICKKKQKQLLFLSSINKTFYHHLVDTTQQIHISIIDSLLLFTGFPNKENEHNIFNTVLKDESELRSLIEYSEQYQFNLLKSNQKKFKYINLQMIDTKQTTTIPYPLSEIYDNLLLIYDIISLTNEKHDLVSQCDALYKQKNLIFIGLKSLESDIVHNDNSYKELHTYVKGIEGMLEQYKEIKDKNDIDSYTKFSNNLQSLKNINWNNLAMNNELSLNTMTMKSEYSESEHNSIVERKSNKIRNIKKSSSKKSPFSKSPINNRSHYQTYSSVSQTSSMLKTKNSSTISINKQKKRSLGSLKCIMSIGNKIKQSKTEKFSRADTMNTPTKERDTLKMIQTSFGELIPTNFTEIDSVCDEMSQVKKDKMKIGKLIIKGQGGMVNNFTYENKGKELETFKFAKHNNACGCCVSCT